MDYLSDEEVGKAKFVKDKVLDDIWWDIIDYILSFTNPMYDMIRACETDKPSPLGVWYVGYHDWKSEDGYI